MRYSQRTTRIGNLRLEREQEGYYGDQAREVRELARAAAPHVHEHTQGASAVVDMAENIMALRLERDALLVSMAELYGVVHGLQRLGFVFSCALGIPYTQHLTAPLDGLQGARSNPKKILDSALATSHLLAQAIPLLQEVRRSQDALKVGVAVFKEAILGEELSAAQLVDIAEDATPYRDLATELARAHMD